MSREGQKIETNGWIPDEQVLDGGANSRLHLARRGDELAVIKFCSAWRPDSERYKRFKGEIEALQEFSDEAGIMPVLDSNVPPPGRGQFPWYVMPEATPLSKYRPASSPVDSVVPGLATTAGTLRRMHEREYSHRDVKPSNLFVMADGSFVVGDLGLVGVPPDLRDSFTQQGGAVGPANFLAPEMLEWQPGNPAFAADVYSLMKTLWALVAGRRFPLPGHQRADDAQSLAAITGDERLTELDRLVERATDHDPERRPSMAEVEEELQAWVDSAQEGETEDDELALAVAETREQLTDRRSAAARAESEREAAAAAFEELDAAMAPLFDSLRSLGMGYASTSDDTMLDATLGFPFLEEIGAPLLLSKSQTFHFAEVSERADGVRLAVAASVGHQDDHNLICAVGILVYSIPPTLGGSNFAWSNATESKADGLAVSRDIASLAADARAQMPAAMAAFTALAETL